MNSKKRDSAYERKFFGIILFVSFFVLIGLLYVYENVEYTSLSYKYMSLEKRYKDLCKENDMLRYKVERLSSPSRIERYAKAKLGMVYPRKTVYIDISPSEINVVSASGGKYIASP